MNAHHCGVFLACIVFFLVVLVLVGAGFALGMVACILGLLLLGMGAVSSSFLIGLCSRSSTDGIRALVLQCCVLAGIPAGATCAFLGQAFLSQTPVGWDTLICGASGGALAGLIVALMLDQLSRRLHRWALDRIKPSREGIERAAQSTEQSL
jgi:hypothetical protein